MTIPKGLTPKQSAFAGFVASGLSYSDAYKKAYETKGKDATVNVLASRLAKKDHVRQAIDDLKADKKEAKRTHEKLNAKWILERLKSEAMDDSNPPSTRVRALELLGKSEGVFDESSTVVVEHRNPDEIEKELRDRLSGFFSEA
tara:strand:- start:133 stop:564 length:432 start_codon:yes stop_codon:yes gene_type:complete